MDGLCLKLGWFIEYVFLEYVLHGGNPGSYHWRCCCPVQCPITNFKKSGFSEPPMKKWYSYIITVNWFANVRIVTGAFLCGAMVSMAEVESELLCHGTSRTQQTNTAPFGEKICWQWKCAWMLFMCVDYSLSVSCYLPPKKWQGHLTNFMFQSANFIEDTMILGGYNTSPIPGPRHRFPTQLCAGAIHH